MSYFQSIHRHRLCQIPRFVDIRAHATAAAEGCVFNVIIASRYLFSRWLPPDGPDRAEPSHEDFNSRM